MTHKSSPCAVISPSQPNRTQIWRRKHSYPQRDSNLQAYRRL